MLVKTIKILTRYLRKKKSNLITSKKNSIFDKSVPLFAKKFGNLNPDKFFYIIHQPGTGRGLFSLFSSVLCHLDVSESLGFIPVIDFENFPCVYNDPELEENLNAWEYYFDPVSQYKLDEVYSSKNVFFSVPNYPDGYSYSITSEPRLYKVFKKYIKIKSFVMEVVESYFQRHFNGKLVLGVHFRGQEMKTTPGHWYPPTKQQMRLAIDLMCKKYDFNSIFIVSEDASYVDFLKREYNGKIDILVNDHYRTYGNNAYKEYPRQRHFFLLGQEVLIDTLLLSRCNGLVYCTSNVATVADFINHSSYIAKIKINNGPNFNNPLLARYSYQIKSFLPHSVGGFSKDFSILNCSNK